MRKINAKFNTAFISEAGSALQNRDYFAFVEMDDFACYVIADGIDDDLELESAKIAVASIIRQFNDKPSMRKRAIKSWLKVANQELLDQSRTMRLKASVTVVVTDYMSMVYGMAGNTRLQLFREGTLIYQTKDHSLSSNLVAEGKISKDKVASHLERNNLYCYLGQPEAFNPEISATIKLEEGDIITLLSRGIWENVDEGEMADAIEDAKKPQQVLNNVEDLILSGQPEKLENYTLAAIFIDRVYKDPGRRQALIKRMIAVAIPVLLIIAGLLIFSHISQAQRQDKIATMNGHFKQAQMLSENGNFVRAADEYKAALDIAQALKLPEDQKNFENYYKTALLIVDADTALHQKEFAKAVQKYADALTASYFADQLGLEYIQKQQSLIADYMRVTELIQSGDSKLERKDLIGAHLDYLEAKVIATRLYYEEGRKEAADKLAKIDEQLKISGAQAKEQEAMVYEQQANSMVRAGNYEGAVSMLMMASGIYDQAGKSDKSGVIQQKIAAIESKMTDAQKASLMENVSQEGARYEAEGDQLMNGREDYDGAMEQYSLALDLYNQSGNKEKAALVQSKMTNLNARKQNAQTFDMQNQGMEKEREGDLAVAQSQFDDAKTAYYYAIQDYSSVGLANNVSMVQRKIDSLDQKHTAFEQQKSKAATYVADGDSKTQAGDYANAKYLYMLAGDIYNNLGLKTEKDGVNEKIKLLHKLSKGAV
ncbi:serine/threonine protein phosphatase PrpC [Sporomusaceae bacterium BoRhaA]|uniref:PP2C family protein-serine/threonine phosphatase n=1 Tax=Pelorhabdus rhamnosifermentans TaxID=2772457 RepID=UPI001C061BAE|nr:hypothetical protein [Pelorhabdus rhamnosifermentans]MBU2703392.1 serine/threonine protein phosphatase PrpC [Pelorhabdus rhamnosifermentans]